jgi:hypothetical protein
MTAQSGSRIDGRRGLVILAAVAALVVVVALIALVFSLVGGSSFDDPDEFRSAMADAGFSCEPEPPSGQQGQLSLQACALEDGGRVVLGVYESGDRLEEHVASLGGQPRPLVYGDNWFIEARFSPRPPKNHELLTRLAEHLDAETANLDL